MAESKSDDEFHGLLFMDRTLPIWLKILIWLIALLIVSVQSVKSLNELSLDFSPIYVIAPTLGMFCLSGAVLRLLGIRWPYVLWFWMATLISLPVMYIIMAIAELFNRY